MADLKTIWNDLVSRYTDDPRMANKLWIEIEKQYSSKNRHYHNLTHLESMAENAIKHKDKIIDFDVIMFSIFYHDIIYKPTRQDNEQKSGEVAVDRLTKLGLTAGKILKCQSQIMATKNHNTNGDSDTDYLVDFDLAILGDSPGNYSDYASKIRAEYSIYPDFLYKPGRKKVLQHFLNMERIFKTNEFYQDYEQQARINLANELQKL